jgi:surface antigen
MPRIPLLIALLLLSACGSGSGERAGDFVGGSVAVECAPFARALSGIQLSGAAADWWWQAGSRYARTDSPAVGSVLVLRRSGRLPSGHVAVVSQVLGSREILVTQANWVHHRVSQDQPVIDVSADNDWSEVRIWWPPTGAMGITDYPAYGFIRAERPATHDQLAAATPRAIRVAASE